MELKKIAIGLAFGVSATAMGCGHAPKPQELVTLESMRQGDAYDKVLKTQAQLMKESEEFYTKANEAWEEEELETSKHYALLGTIKLRTALTLQEQITTQQQSKALAAKAKGLEEEYADLKERIRNAEEKAGLREEIVATKAEAELKGELANAQQKINEARIAQKQADSVEAKKYAPDTYAQLEALLSQASAAVSSGDAVSATKAADQAKARADAAYSASRPLYMKARKESDVKAENDALQKEAASIAGVTPTIENIGQTQQLVIPILGLFKGKGTEMLAEKEAVVTALGQLLAKHPRFHVIINGYTSYKVPTPQRTSISQSRAQTVANKFIALGVTSDRVAASGRGVEKLANKRRTSNVNDRVEVQIILL